MKKLSKLFLAFIMVVSLTGCVKYNVNMEVKDDRSVTLEVIYGMEVGTLGDSSEDSEIEVSTSDYAYLEEYGYKVEKFEETKDDVTTAGVKITKTFSNIDDITFDSKVTVNFNEAFNEKNKDKIKDLKFFYKDGNNYAANFIFDFIGDDEERNDTYDSYITDLKYTIKLPVANASNNASTVSEDGKELTWNLTYSKVNEVNFAFTLGSGFNWMIVIAAVVAAVVIIAVIVLLTKKKKPAVGQPMMNSGQVMNQGAAPMNPGVNPMGQVDPNQQAMVNQPMQPDMNQQPMITPEAAQPEVVATPEVMVANPMPEANPMSVDQPGAENPLLSVNPVPVEETPTLEPANTDVAPVVEAAPVEMPAAPEIPVLEPANTDVAPVVETTPEVVEAPVVPETPVVPEVPAVNTDAEVKPENVG